MEAFNKELEKNFFKSMDAQELQDPEKDSAISVRNLNSIVSKMSSKKSAMIDIRPTDAIKLDIVELNNSQTYSDENILPEDALHKM